MAQPPHFEIDGVIYFITTRLKEEGRFLTEREAEMVVNTLLDSLTRKRDNSICLCYYAQSYAHSYKTYYMWNFKGHAAYQGKIIEASKQREFLAERFF